MTGAEREALAGRLRALVASRCYAQAQTCFEAYCRALAEALANLPPGDPGVCELEGEWRTLFEETRLRALIGRAHAAQRLARLPKAPRHYEPAPLPRRTWECLG